MNSMNDTQNQQGTLLKEQILKKDASAWTHNGKFHADDVFSAALLLYLNPEIRIFRGNQVPEDFTGVVFDIGRGRYDHHQKDSRIRENGIPYAAFGLLWEGLGADILGEELAEKFVLLDIPMIVDRSADEEKDDAKAEWSKVYEAIFAQTDSTDSSAKN